MGDSENTENQNGDKKRPHNMFQKSSTNVKSEHHRHIEIVSPVGLIVMIKIPALRQLELLLNHQLLISIVRNICKCKME